MSNRPAYFNIVIAMCIRYLFIQYTTVVHGKVLHTGRSINSNIDVDTPDLINESIPAKVHRRVDQQTKI